MLGGKIWLALAVAAAVVLPAGPSRAAGERLLYQIDETAPGTRSQGWRGTLFDKNGTPIELAAGQTMQTPGGVFVGVACTVPWRPCGAIAKAVLFGQKKDLAPNSVMPQPWRYRIYLTAPGSRSEGTRGELMRAGASVSPASPTDREVKTPMGTFIWVENAHPWGAHGWFVRE